MLTRWKVKLFVADTTSTSGADKILTPANIVTLIRICLVPAFVVALLAPWPDFLHLPDLNNWKCWIAAVIFIVISGTDWLDGYLARSRNEVTDFGKFMDPLADKILVTAALLVLIELGVLPSWVVLIILAREFIVSGVRMIAASKGEVIAASWYGKFKTVFQMIAIVLFTVKDSVFIMDFSMFAYRGLYLLSWFVMLIALVLTIVSMIDYIYKARHLLGFGAKHDAAAQSVGESIAQEISRSEHVLALAREKGLTLATAESCTGGLISAALTAVPGSSDVVKGGIVSYTNEVKINQLHVSEETIAEVTEVSQEAAVQMAEGARNALGVDMAVSVTGIAGPTGAMPGKPIGTVWIGIATPHGSHAELHQFPGNREEVRAATVDRALDLFIESM